MTRRFRLRPGLLRALIRVTFAGWLLGLAPPAAAQEIASAHTSRYVGKGRWDWTVFIRAAPEVLARVECVEYTLHESFPDPRRRVCAQGDPAAPFALSASGWGTFTVPIRVLMKNGETRELSHPL